MILITTKKAKKEGHNVALTISNGFSTRGIDEYDRVGVWEYYPLQWEMMRNTYVFGKEKQDAQKAAQNASKNIAGQLKYNPFKGIANDQIVGVDGKLNPAATTLLWGDDLDWDKESFRTGHRQEYNLSYSSKTDKSDAYASLGYLNDKGYMINTDFERFTGRVNYNVYPVKWFKAGMNIAGTRSSSNISTSTVDDSSGYGNMVRFIRGMAPIYPIYKHDFTTGEYLLDANNQRIYDTDGNRVSNNGRHTIAEQKWNQRLIERDLINGRAFVEISPLEGLKFTVSASLDSDNRRRKVNENTVVGDGAPAGRLNIRSQRYTTYQFSQIVNYAKKINNHSFDVLAGHENWSWQHQYMYGMRQGEILTGMAEFGNYVTINTLDSYTDNYKKEGYLFRFNYDYSDKYYASMSYRRDGSSRFHKDNRWGNFWSFGASWRIDQEDFMEGFHWVNSLKLRASYGETGNDRLLDADGYAIYYAHQTLYSNGINNKDEPGVYFNLFGNKKLKWETQVSTDIGLEFTLFDRLSGSIEYFQKNSRDLLFQVPTPASSGVTTTSKNIGKVSNKGIELDLNYTAFKNKDWTVSVGANLTHVKNEIVRLPEDQRENGIIKGTKKLMEGKSIYDYWLRQYVGVDPSNGAAYYIYDESLKGKEVEDYFIKDGKQYTYTLAKAKYDYSGTTTPKIFGGFNAAAKYRSFDLSVLFSYALGGKMLDGAYQTLMNNVYGYAMHTDVKKAWKQEGDITNVPRLDQSKTADFDGTSTRWLISNNYLNFKNVTLSYHVPRKLLQTIGLDAVRLSVSGENMYQFNKRKGLNAMANYSGTTYNEYMPARSITFGLNVSF